MDGKLLSLITSLYADAVSFGEGEGKSESSETVNSVGERIKFKGDAEVRFFGCESKEWGLIYSTKPYKVNEVTDECYKIKMIKAEIILMCKVNAK